MSTLLSKPSQIKTAPADASACLNTEKTITIGVEKLEKLLSAYKKELLTVKRAGLDAARAAERAIADIDLKLNDLTQLN